MPGEETENFDKDKLVPYSVMWLYRGAFGYEDKTDTLVTTINDGGNATVNRYNEHGELVHTALITKAGPIYSNNKFVAKHNLLGLWIENKNKISYERSKQNSSVE